MATRRRHMLDMNMSHPLYCRGPRFTASVCSRCVYLMSAVCLLLKFREIYKNRFHNIASALWRGGGGGGGAWSALWRGDHMVVSAGSFWSIFLLQTINIDYVVNGTIGRIYYKVMAIRYHGFPATSHISTSISFLIRCAESLPSLARVLKSSSLNNRAGRVGCLYAPISRIRDMRTS